MKIYYTTRQLASKTYRQVRTTLQEHRSMISLYLSCLIAMFIFAIILFVVVKVRTETFILGYQISFLQEEKNKLNDDISLLLLKWEKITRLGSLLQNNQEKEFELLPPEIWQKKGGK